ncbi:efflux RND transporter periplasmic adaptor subunit [Clostridiaceae bacterium AF31-3BH]|nr:efflux RND transporter periplasmic adaptor subunit [Clostridiaceae bacterium AF31-3BH]
MTGGDNMKAKKLMAMGLAVTLCVSATACGKNKETTQVSKVSVEVENPQMGELTSDTTYIGTVEPQQQVYVMPKLSGTVTQVNYKVGDTVKEGDVLFKIDDKAYQVQMDSAQAAYNTAQAGATAATSGARDLQNYQTEEQIRQLQKNLNDTYESKDDMEDDLDDLREKGKTANAQVASLQSDVDTLSQNLGVQKQDLAAKQTAMNEAKADYDSKTASSSTATEDEKKLAEAAYNTAKTEYDAAAAVVTATSSQLALAKQGLSAAQAGVNTINSGKTQLKSGIDQIETSQDTLTDSLNTAKQAYSITQNEVYPQTDATYAAQLNQAAVGIESAQMQLDYCTVTAPISGVIEAINVEKEGMAAAGNVAYIISNKDSMTVTFDVAEAAKNTLNIGDHVTVERNGQTFDGSITEIGTMAGQQTKLFRVKATVTGAGDALPNGVSVKVSATTEKEDNKMLIPFDSLYFSGGDAYVYCVEDNKLVRTSVTVGLMDDEHAVIEDGLTTDSLVVDNWSAKLRNGAEVEIVTLNGEDVVNNTEDTSEGTEESQEQATDETSADEEAAE